MVPRNRLLMWAACGVALLPVTVLAQFSETITGFETNREGQALAVQPVSLGDLYVVMFQDPREADVTAANVLADTSETPLPSSEESFVADFTGDGFYGAGGSVQSLDIRFQWQTPSDTTRWVLVETYQSPILGDPALHLDGVISLKLNFPYVTSEFPELLYTQRIGVALLIRETGKNIPQGFRDGDPGALEFVGVTSVTGADTANPIPVPATYFNGPTSSGDGGWVDLTFDLDALQTAGRVIGWTAEGGDGVLDATGVGDGVNRGVLAGLVITVDPTDTTSQYVEVLVDNIVFDAPVVDPAYPPSISTPVIAMDTSVRVKNVLSSATQVRLEIDRSDENNEDPFTADETYDLNPGGALYVDITVPALAVGDRVRARQTNPSGTSGYSLEVKVNPPAVFTFTLSLDEDGNLGAAPADYEFVGAASDVNGAPQGKPIFRQNAVWQNVEFSLIPGAEPVIDFAGGNGQLQPDGGLYNIDAVFMSIDVSDPQAGPYDVFIDHVYLIDVSDNEVVISDAESANPFPNFRGQSTATVTRSSALSTVASYDGTSSNRIQWEWVTNATDNVVAPYRPNVAFADTAKAVGFWLLVEDARTSTLALPAVEKPIVGSAPAVQVSNIDLTATQVTLLVNGSAAGSVAGGSATVNITPSVVLQLGDSVSAQYTTASESSDVAYPTVVQAPVPPTVQGPLVQGMTSVTVAGVMNSANATASTVRLYQGDNLIGTKNPAGAASVVFDNLSPALVAGQQISATQTVNGVTSGRSLVLGVGTGEIKCVVINELLTDEYGQDAEFVELYNSGPDPVDISGWVLRASDEVAPPADDNPDYTIPASTILAAGDYYVIGSALVANVDLVVGTTNLWENEREALQLMDQNGVVVDTVITEGYQGVVAVSPAEGAIWGRIGSLDVVSAYASYQRWFDGYDTNNNGRDFGYLPATPGATNAVPSQAPLNQNFNSGVAGNPVPGWTGTFVNLRYVNPGVVSGANPYAIPASPDGGLAASCVDESGGGNVCVFSDEARYAYSLSVQVYFDSSGTPWLGSNFLEGDCWGIGFGTEGNLYQINSVFPLAETGQNGNTGLVWRYYRFETVDNGTVGLQVLQLVNENDGGPDGQVLFDVPEANITTGWHTLTLTRNYDSWSASFDALTASGTVTGVPPGSFFIGFREFAAAFPAGTRPPTIDALQITEPAAPTLGACCSFCECIELTAAECVAIGGAYTGDGTTCADNDANGIADICEAFIPPAPTIEGTLCNGGLVVTVSGLVPESSTVTVYQAGVNPIGTAATGGAATVAVVVNPALASGQSITAKQTAGGIDSAPSVAVVVGTCTAPEATIVINELAYDDTGADDYEFVELYNAGPVAVDIGGWAIRCSDTVGPPADNNPDFGIPAGTILAAGDFYVIGQVNVPNVDLVIPLNDQMENDNEAVQLVDNTGNVLDTVIYERNKGPVAVSPAEGGIWANFAMTTGSELSWSRYLDGWDTDNNGRDFGARRWTPGTSNLGLGSIVTAYTVFDVDALAVGTPVPGLTRGSFVGAQVINPTVSSAANPNAIPASPQGGNCTVAWDPAGGANIVPGDNVFTGSFFDLYVYIDTTPYGEGGAESTTYGLMGTIDPVYNFPDPSGLLFGDVVTANGNTGLGWIFEKEDSANLISMKLVDAKAGGDSSPGPATPAAWTVIASINMVGVPSGWHRISINYNGTTGAVVGKYDGQVYSYTSIPGLVGQFGIGYRESLNLVPTKLRPPTVDTVTMGDAEVDGDVDLDDYNVIGNCLNGPNVNTPPAGCSAAQFDAADIDRDNDVDLEDWSYFQTAF